jgi:uncharacterized protein YacL
MMVAERLMLSLPPERSKEAVVAVLESESAAQQFMERLRALGVPMRDVTFLRVATSDQTYQFRQNTQLSLTSPQSSKWIIGGAITGFILTTFVGSYLFSINILFLSFIESIVVCFVAMAILGIVLGSMTGAILGAYLAQRSEAKPLPIQNIDGYLISAKLSNAQLIECQAIAEELGAKKIFS